MKIETPIEIANRLRGTLLSEEDVKLIERLYMLHPAAFVTGSALWCPDTARDFDICVNAKKEDVALFLDIPDNSEGSFGSLRIPGSNINVVCLCAKRAAVWYTATRLMSALAPIRDKQKRVGVFETLCGLVSAAELRHNDEAVL